MEDRQLHAPFLVKPPTAARWTRMKMDERHRNELSASPARAELKVTGA